MRLSALLLFVFLGGCLALSRHRSVSISMFSYRKFDVIPPCAHTCLSDMFAVAADLFSLQNTTENFSELCRAYNDAVLCVDEQEDCLGGVFFDTVFGGLETFCSEEETAIEPYSECLSNVTEAVVLDCNDNCTFTESIMELSTYEFIRRFARVHRTRKMMAEELGPVCTSLGCMASCVARRLNEECDEPAGTIVVEAVLRPFFKGAAILDELGNRAKTLVNAQMPEECRYLANTQQLQEIAKGVEPEEGSGEEGSGEGSGEEGAEGSGEEGSGEEGSGEGSGEEEKPKRPIRWRKHPLGFWNPMRRRFSRGRKESERVVVIASKTRFVRSPDSGPKQAVRDILNGNPPRQSHESRESEERLKRVNVKN